MTRLPLATPVRSVRNLARRLLLTTADAPEGQAPHSFQTVRLRALSMQAWSAMPPSSRHSSV